MDVPFFNLEIIGCDGRLYVKHQRVAQETISDHNEVTIGQYGTEL
jgi:hypothetical protein